MENTIEILETENREIKREVDLLTVRGQELLLQFKTATMMTSPTIVSIEEDYKRIIFQIFTLNRSLKFIKKAIKQLHKLD